MPLLRLTTNQPPNNAEVTMKELSTGLARLLGKSEQYVMVQLETDAALVFGGSAEPCLLAEVASLGLDEEASRAITPELCALLGAQMNVPPERIYIWYASPPRAFWGWNGKTFG